ncbi:MAG: signal peptidase I [Halorientalis sp.]
MDWLTGRRDTLNRLALVVFVVVLAPFVVFAFPPLVGANHSYVVLSSSMRPGIHAGDVVIVSNVDPSKIEVGDIVTYRAGGDQSDGDSYRITHRVVKSTERNGTRYFQTKGDANEEPDEHLVPASAVVGRVAFSMPLIGRVIAFIGTPLGTVSLVVVPAVLLVINEVWNALVSADSATGSGDATAGDQQPEEATEGTDGETDELGTGDGAADTDEYDGDKSRTGVSDRTAEDRTDDET